MLIIVAAILVVLIAVVLGLAAAKPNTLRVQRTTTIKAPPARIFPLINDFHNWASWSPYDRYDAAMQKTLSGAPAGPGAVYEWTGNNKVGAGRMEITSAAPPSKVVVKLDFLRPFEGHNVAEFTLEPAGDATNVTWAMDGPRPFVTKLMSVFLNMDALIGNDFAAGLTNMKAVIER